jgi:hypothetical protein
MSVLVETGERMDDATRQDEERARRNLTPDQEEFVELYRRLGEVQKETIRVNMLLLGYDESLADVPPSSPDRRQKPDQEQTPLRERARLDGIPLMPPSEHDSQILRRRLAILGEEAEALQSQIDRLDAELHPPGSS